MRPAQYPTTPYVPLHKGHIDSSTGHYIRKNEDLVVAGTPPLILRRVYVSGFRESRQFGVGAMHNGEWSVVGDAAQFQWAALVRPGEARIRFVRTSPGTSFLNATFEHRASAGEWNGAALYWTGTSWALRKADGSLMLFQPCGPGTRQQVCAMIRARDAGGNLVHYRRDTLGRLLKIETEDGRWIAFDYDEHIRIERAFDSSGGEARYYYDAGGRLVRVTAADGRVSVYGYTGRDELATIVEPGADIENAYDSAGRCARQVNHRRGGAPYVFDFSYLAQGDRIVRTGSARSDGTWARYTFDEESYTTSETVGSGAESAVFTLARDPSTHAVTAVTLTCPGRDGLLTRHSSPVGIGEEERVKRDLLVTRCFWPAAPRR